MTTFIISHRICCIAQWSGMPSNMAITETCNFIFWQQNLFYIPSHNYHAQRNTVFTPIYVIVGLCLAYRRLTLVLHLPQTRMETMLVKRYCIAVKSNWHDGITSLELLWNKKSLSFHRQISMVLYVTVQHKPLISRWDIILLPILPTVQYLRGLKRHKLKS